MSTGDVGGAFLEALMDRPDVFVRLDKEVASVLIKKYQEYKKYKKTDGKSQEGNVWTERKKRYR